MQLNYYYYKDVFWEPAANLLAIWVRGSHTTHICSFHVYADPQRNKQACRPTNHKQNLTQITEDAWNGCSYYTCISCASVNSHTCIGVPFWKLHKFQIPVTCARCLRGFWGECSGPSPVSSSFSLVNTQNFDVVLVCPVTVLCVHLFMIIWVVSYRMGW